MARKKTHEEFVAEVKALVGDEYVVLSQYKTSKTKFKYLHTICGNTFEVTPNHFLRGGRCLVCTALERGDTFRKSQKDFESEVFNVYNNEYTVVGKYKTSKTPIEIRHNICNRTYTPRPSNFLRRKSSCSHCYGNKKIEHDDFAIRFDAVRGSTHELLSKYVNSNTKVIVRCKKCLYKFEILPREILNSQTCAVCSGTKKKTTEDFRKEVEVLGGGEYLLVSEYVNNRAEVSIKHTACGSVYSTTPHTFITGSRCSDCFGTKKRTFEEFIDELERVHPGEFTVLSDYLGTGKKIKIKHNACGNIYITTPYVLLKGHSCGGCSKSKGEKKIETTLSTVGLPYQKEYRIKECRDKLPLPFDFAITKDKKIMALIEYDGEQHYKPVRHFGGETALRKTQHRDAIKDKYCADNGIPLIRIPYWEYDNIDAILTEKLLPMLKESAA